MWLQPSLFCVAMPHLGQGLLHWLMSQSDSLSARRCAFSYALHDTPGWALAWW